MADGPGSNKTFPCVMFAGSFCVCEEETMYRAMVIDDEPITRMDFVDLLERSGYHVMA